MTTTDDNTTRTAALALLKSGRATISDVESLAGRDRQLVAYWAKAAGIDPGKARAKLLRKLWNKSTKR
jgi:hypothetical protein